MKYFKITKTWAVKAESETEAIKLVAAAPEEYLDSETVTRTEYKKPQPKTGWGNAVKAWRQNNSPIHWGLHSCCGSSTLLGQYHSLPAELGGLRRHHGV